MTLSNFSLTINGFKGFKFNEKDEKSHEFETNFALGVEQLLIAVAMVGITPLD